ncbi:hypothetical protein [Psychromonas sp. KJ10-2]|uniref:hypothetical protein n=1 Tax=Psychromonas sp. KJ10-2 TaxID=3391822 RepID=UPI0039B4C6C7
MNFYIKLTLCCSFIVSTLSFADTNINFDIDENGLYEDQERKALLNYLQQQYPELSANYDTNDDGGVLNIGTD